MGHGGEFNPLLRTHFELIFTLLGRTRVSFILPVHTPEPAFTFTKPPIAISQSVSSRAFTLTW
jgi:hypothetical protein